ncbi:MAG: hypothetical protein ACK5MN_03255 [Lachnospiraceae bacterium]
MIVFNGTAIPIAKVARIMSKSEQFVRVGLQRGLLPIGYAYECNDDKRGFGYYISPKLLYEVTGALVEGTYEIRKEES